MSTDRTETTARPFDTPLSIILLSLWFGLLTGLGEVAIMAIRKYALHRFLFLSMDSVWMAPVADVVLFATAGIVLAALRRILPGRFRIPAVMLLSALAIFTLLLTYGPLWKPAGVLLALGGGMQAARVIHRHSSASGRLIWWTLPAMAILVLVLGAVLRISMLTGEHRVGTASNAPRPAAPNVLLIVLDTIRSWNLGIYGYSRPTTPELQRWMRGGVRFEHVLSTAPWTLPSHASMFTGHFPHELSADWLTPLDDKFPTLAELLTAEGYRSGGFVANTTYCSYESGLARGFGHYEDYPVTGAQVMLSSALGRYLAGSRFVRRKLLRKSAGDVNTEFLGWLGENKQERPFFVFLNYLDAHNPYQPPKPFDTLFSDPGSARYLTSLREDTPAREWTPEVLRAAQDKYDESIAYMDHELGQLFGELKRRGLWDNTLVIVTADHGEEFGERGVFFHGNSLYRGALEVPLLMHLPGTIPDRLVSTTVSLRDLAATVLNVAGSSHDGEMPGRSLARFWDGRVADSALTGDTLLMELSYSSRLPRATPVAKGPMKAVLMDNRRLIRNGDGREELYDFANDRTDQRDLAALPAEADMLAALRRALESLAPRRNGLAARSGDNSIPAPR
ncbi:MAG: sulfatase [Gemmatimonadota bacterium]